MSWLSTRLPGCNCRSNQINPAVALAFYDKYHKLPSAWKLGTSLPITVDDETKVLHFDGPAKVCSKHARQNEESEYGNVWQKYLPPNSNIILSYWSCRFIQHHDGILWPSYECSSVKCGFSDDDTQGPGN